MTTEIECNCHSAQTGYPHEDWCMKEIAAKADLGHKKIERYQLEDGNVWILAEDLDEILPALRRAEDALARHSHTDRACAYALASVQTALVVAGVAKATLVPKCTCGVGRPERHDRSCPMNDSPECPTCGGHGIVRHEGTLDVVDECPACQDCRPEGAA